MLIVLLFCCPIASVLAEEMPTDVYPDRGVQRVVIDSRHIGHRYEVFLAYSQPGPVMDKPAPLLVVLDGFLLGMTAIEAARLMTAAGEMQPIHIAAVSADGEFATRTARRSPDFSADVDNLRE